MDATQTWEPAGGREPGAEIERQGVGETSVSPAARQTVVLALLLLLIVGLAVRRAPAQEASEARTFEAAARAFEVGTYERAEREFAEFVRSFPASLQVPEAILYQARAAIEQQKLQPAVQLLATNLDKAGLLADNYRYWLGKAYLESTNYLAAAEAFSELIKDFPRSPRLLEASYGEALARFRLKDWPRVIELLQRPEGTFQAAAKARANDEFAVRGLLLLGEALVETRQFRAAELAVSRLPEPELVPEYKWRRQYLLCRVQMADERLASALAGTSNLVSLAVATGQRGRIAESHALRGEILERRNDLDAAIGCYTNNLANDMPADRRRQAFLKTIELTLALNRILDAAQRLEAFFAQYPQDAGSDVALLTLGEVHLKQHLLNAQSGVTNAVTNLVAGATNNLQAALGQFDKLLATFTNSPLAGQAQLNRGWCFWVEGRTNESLLAFKAAVEALPFSEDHAVARLKLADAQFAVGDCTNALRNYGGVASNYTSLPRVRDNLTALALYQALRASLQIGDLEGATDALRRVLRSYPGGLFGDRGLLLVGQGYAQAGRPGDARAIFETFLQQSPDSPLRPEVKLAVARTYGEAKDWDRAIAQYRDWLEAFGTNALRPDAAFDLAWASYQAGSASNALNLFTNFLADFPAHRLAPQAQYWLGDFYYVQADFVNAQINYQRVFENPIWPPSMLSYQARMMAGRAAFARQVWKDAGDHFRVLINANDTNCPPELVAESYFALGDTLSLQDTDTADPLKRFEEAKTAFRRIPQLFPTSALAPRAWGRIGDCCLQQAGASQDSKYYDSATNAYQKVLAPELNADVSTRCQAEMGLGLVLEKEAALQKAPEKTAALKEALDHYLNIVYGKGLDEGEELDPVWLKEAGLAAARLAEELKQWDVAMKLYERLATALPPLRPAMEKKIERAREQGAGERN